MELSGNSCCSRHDHGYTHSYRRIALVAKTKDSGTQVGIGAHCSRPTALTGTSPTCGLCYTGSAPIPPRARRLLMDAAASGAAALLHTPLCDLLGIRYPL